MLVIEFVVGGILEIWSMKFDLECDALGEEFGAEIAVSPTCIFLLKQHRSSVLDRKSGNLLFQSPTLHFQYGRTDMYCTTPSRADHRSGCGVQNISSYR